MKPHLAARPVGDASELFERKCIQVTDLTGDPSYRGLWRADRAGPDPVAGGPTEHGFASPMGYWLSSPVLPTANPANGPVITFATVGEDLGASTAHLGRPLVGGSRRPLQTVRVKSPNSGEGDVTITVGPGGASVTATTAAWKTLAEPVLLALCQYRRFAAIDAEIARLTALAHGDLDHSNMPGVATLRNRRRLVQSARDVRALLLDLPHFEGPLTDSFPYCSTERSAQIFESLAEKLRLEPWSELIDERAEAIEDAYEALSEKLFEYKNFAWEAALETLIIVILVAELGMTIYEMLTP